MGSEIVIRGVTYDTGFVNAGTSTRTVFDLGDVRFDLEVIRDRLGCTAVRPTGGDQDRIDAAATIAAELGLDVWYSPFTCDLTCEQLAEVILEAAVRAERIRRDATGEVVLVAGAEMSMFTRGFLEGNTIGDRIGSLPDFFEFDEVSTEVSGRIDDFFATVIPSARARFEGRITYASLWGERVDWSRFDLAGVDAYRSAHQMSGFADALDRLAPAGVPIAVTEFGASTYRGAPDKGALAEDIVVWSGENPDRLREVPERDEHGQANALEDLYRTITAGRAVAAFAHTFGFWHMPHRSDPERDLDRAGYGIVRPIEGRDGRGDPGARWEPKESFTRLGALYAE